MGICLTQLNNNTENKNTTDAWPLVASLLDSKDPVARMIAARTMALGIPSGLVSEETRAFYPGQSKTTEQSAEFWKAWWRCRNEDEPTRTTPKSLLAAGKCGRFCFGAVPHAFALVRYRTLLPGTFLNDGDGEWYYCFPFKKTLATGKS